MDQIKISLFGLYQTLYKDHPERAWVAMGLDLLELGQDTEARQCAAKAAQIDPQAPELKHLQKKMAVKD